MKKLSESNTKGIFLDTSGLYALLVSNDVFHEAAVGTVEKAVRKRQVLFTTDYIMDECLTLLKARRVAGQCGVLFNLVEKSKAVRLEWIESERFEKAKAVFTKYSDQAYSFTDCTSFVIMKELGITDALSSDGDFRKFGLKNLLS